jgi:hypothetical protein
LAAATILHQAMLEIRMVRHAHLAGQIPVRPLCRAFTGAGESIRAASAHRRASRREEAFRQLVEDWVRKGGPDLAPWFEGRLGDLDGKVHGTTREWVNSLMPPMGQGSEPAAGPVSDLPAGSELRLAKYVAAHTRYEHPHAGSALVQLAVPPRPQAERDGVWDLCGLELESPRLFQVSGTAFHGATDPRLTGVPEAVRSLSLSGGGLTMSADEAEMREKRAGQSQRG